MTQLDQSRQATGGLACLRVPGLSSIPGAKVRCPAPSTPCEHPYARMPRRSVERRLLYRGNGIGDQKGDEAKEEPEHAPADGMAAFAAGDAACPVGEPKSDQEWNEVRGGFHWLPSVELTGA
jgi:hypothetical protein